MALVSCTEKERKERSVFSSKFVGKPRVGGFYFEQLNKLGFCSLNSLCAVLVVESLAMFLIRIYAKRDTMRVSNSGLSFFETKSHLNLKWNRGP